MEIVVATKRTNGAEVPVYRTEHSAGCDLCACINEDITLFPGGRAAIPTGLYFGIPVGFEAQIRPRSGLALNQGVTCLNSPGTIDADYRGEIKVILANLGTETFVVHNGDRIAQAVFAACLRASFQDTQELSATGRGEGGFGSTGS